MDHLVESEPALAREREHHVRLEPREDAALLDHPPELVRKAVTAHPVAAVLLDVRAQQLHAQDRGLALGLDPDLRDRPHQPQHVLVDPRVQIVASAKLPLRECALDGFLDPLPGMLDHQVVDAPIGELERRAVEYEMQQAASTAA